MSCRKLIYLSCVINFFLFLNITKQIVLPVSCTYITNCQYFLHSFFYNSTSILLIIKPQNTIPTVLESHRYFLYFKFHQSLAYNFNIHHAFTE